ISSLLSDRRPDRLWSRPSIEPIGLTKKGATFGPLSRATVDAEAVGARESLTIVGDYAIFHWVRSRLGAGLPRSPQNSAGPKGSQTLELFRSDPGLGSADRLARDRDQQGKQPVTAQVPGRQCQTKGRGGAQLIVRLNSISLQRRRRKKQAWGLIVEGFGLWPGR